MRRSLRPIQFARMVENRWVSAESTFIDMALFDQCVDPAMRSVVTDRCLPVWAALLTHQSVETALRLLP